MSGCSTPCPECPFSSDCNPGDTGGSDPTRFIGQAVGPFFLPCHMDPGYEKDRYNLGLLQCAGAAMFRANIGVASLMPPQIHALPASEKAFGSPVELLAHHLKISLTEAVELLEKRPLDVLLKEEFERSGVKIYKF